MAKYTDQQAFDHMVNHLRTLKGRCTDENRQCVNRSRDGRACVVGSLLTDEEAASLPRTLPADETYGELDENYGMGNHSLSGLSLDMLSAMQTAHDCHRSWDGPKFIVWIMVRRVAKKHGLDAGSIPPDDPGLQAGLKV